MVYGGAGENLDYYADTGGAFFLGVATSDTIAQITLLTPYGGPTSAQAIAHYGFQQYQGAETPEPCTAAFFGSRFDVRFLPVTESGAGMKDSWPNDSSSPC